MGYVGISSGLPPIDVSDYRVSDPSKSTTSCRHSSRVGTQSQQRRPHDPKVGGPRSWRRTALWVTPKTGAAPCQTGPAPWCYHRSRSPWKPGSYLPTEFTLARSKGPEVQDLSIGSGGGNGDRFDFASALPRRRLQFRHGSRWV